MLTVRRLPEPLVSGADLPQFFDRPYWRSYGHAAFNPQTKQGVAVYFDFGAQLHPEFKTAMLDLLKLAGSGSAMAPVVESPVRR